MSIRCRFDTLITAAVAAALFGCAEEPESSAPVSAAPSEVSSVSAAAQDSMIDQIVRHQQALGGGDAASIEQELSVGQSNLRADNDRFGRNITVDGDTAVISAAQGLFVYERDIAGSWNLKAVMSTSTGSIGDISIDGDTLVVGAPNDDPTGFGVTSGAVYVFQKPAAGWLDGMTETATLTPSDPVNGDAFGVRVALDDGVLVVGARGDDLASNTIETNANEGSAYVFVAPSTGVWVDANEDAKLQASDAASGDQLGFVDIDGDTIIVGSTGTDGNKGGIYVFVKPASGWASGTEDAKLTSSRTNSGSSFGALIDIEGDTIVGGANGEDYSTNGTQTRPNIGAAYVFVRPASGWSDATEDARLTKGPSVNQERFGNTVLIVEDTIVVGAPNRYAGSNNKRARGSSHVYVRPAAGWSDDNTPNFEFSHDEDPAISDNFGTVMAYDGAGTLFAGVPNQEDGSAVNQGAAYIFARNANGSFGNRRKVTAGYDPGRSDDAEYGYAVAVRGDIAVVGAPGDDEEATDAGAVFLFYRAPNSTQWNLYKKIVASDAQTDDAFGASVAISDDWIAVGAPEEDGAGTDRGAVYLFGRGAGAVDTWNQVRKLTAPTQRDSSHFGHAVALDGERLAASQPMNTMGGEVHLFERNTPSANAWGVRASVEDTTVTNAGSFGLDLDLDGDFLIVGSVEQSVALFGKDEGGADTWGKLVTLTSSTPGDAFGESVSVDSSGLAIVGESGEDSVSIYARDASSSPASWPLLKRVTGVASSGFGSSVAISSRIALVGAEEAGVRGAAFELRRYDGGLDTWTSSQIAAGTEDDQGFGEVALDGEDFVIGSSPDTVEVDARVVAGSLPENSAPVASDSTVAASGAVNATLTAADGDGDALTFVVTSQPSVGTLSLTDVTTGAFTYTPDGSSSASQTSFTFVVVDGLDISNEATVTLTLNAPPVAADASETTDEDTALTGTVSVTDADGDTLTYSVVSQPTQGTLSLDASTGAYTYTPGANFNGDDAFTFRANDGQVDSNTGTVSITVTPINDAPVVSAASETTDEDVPVSGTLSGSDVDGDAITYALVGAGSANGGTVTVATGGAFTYTPAADFHGTDTFEVIANDGVADSAGVTITVTVAPINDAPVASDLSVQGTEGSGATGSVAATDADGDALTHTVVSQPTQGTLSLDASTGMFTYTPTDADFNGSDTFTFVANDGQVDSNTATVTIDIAAVNDDPVAIDTSITIDEDTVGTGSVSGTDTDGDTLEYLLGQDPSNGSAVVERDGSFTYTPDPDFHGTDVFTFRVSDGQTFGEGTVTVTVTPVEDAPIFIAPTPEGAVGGVAGMEVRFEVAASDADGDDVVLSVQNLPERATFTGDVFTWTPTESDMGDTMLVLSATDGTTEITRDLTVTVTTSGDDDGDGLSNADEITLGTDPNSDDSDSDTISDSQEVGDDVDAPLDTDGDEEIDALDDDSDEDGILDIDEAGDDDINTLAIDTDEDGEEDFRDLDSDDDEVNDGDDNCPLVANTDQLDTDEDGEGDVCDATPGEIMDGGDGEDEGEEPDEESSSNTEDDGCAQAGSPAGAPSAPLGLLGLLTFGLLRRTRS